MMKLFIISCILFIANAQTEAHYTSMTDEHICVGHQWKQCWDHNKQTDCEEENCTWKDNPCYNTNHNKCYFADDVFGGDTPSHCEAKSDNPRDSNALWKFECTCAPGRDGTRCEFKDACSGKPCKNGGWCRNTQTGYECDCPRMFTGDSCEIEAPNTGCTTACQNGGACVDGFCICPFGFKGVHCEIDLTDDWYRVHTPSESKQKCDSEDSEVNKSWLSNMGSCVDRCRNFANFDCHFFQFGGEVVQRGRRELTLCRMYTSCDSTIDDDDYSGNLPIFQFYKKGDPDYVNGWQGPHVHPTQRFNTPGCKSGWDLDDLTCAGYTAPENGETPTSGPWQHTPPGLPPQEFCYTYENKGLAKWLHAKGYAANRCPETTEQAMDCILRTPIQDGYDYSPDMELNFCTHLECEAPKTYVNGALVDITCASGYVGTPEIFGCKYDATLDDDADQYIAQLHGCYAETTCELPAPSTVADGPYAYASGSSISECKHNSCESPTLDGTVLCNLDYVLEDVNTGITIESPCQPGMADTTVLRGCVPKPCELPETAPTGYTFEDGAALGSCDWETCDNPILTNVICDDAHYGTPMVVSCPRKEELQLGGCLPGQQPFNLAQSSTGSSLPDWAIVLITIVCTLIVSGVVFKYYLSTQKFDEIPASNPHLSANVSVLSETVQDDGNRNSVSQLAQSSAV